MRLYSNPARLQWTAAILLALTAGYVDGYGFLFLKTYLSFMSGNTTSAAVMSGKGYLPAALHSALAILCFVTGSFCGNVLCQSRVSHAHRISFALIAAALAAVSAMQWVGIQNVVVEIASLCLAMGMVNPTVTKIGLEPVSLTFVTGTLNRIGGHLASAAVKQPLTDKQGERDSHLRRAGVDASIWTGFSAGALLSGLLEPGIRPAVLLPPCAVILLLSAWSERAGASGNETSRSLLR